MKVIMSLTLQRLAITVKLPNTQCGMSAHFRAWPRCINMQAEQPAAIAIGACVPATGEAKPLAPRAKIRLCAGVGRRLTKGAVRPDLRVLRR